MAEKPKLGLEDQLLGALVALHGVLGRLTKSSYRPSREELAEVASSAVEVIPHGYLWAFVATLAPLTKVWELLERLEATGARFRRKARARA